MSIVCWILSCDCKSSNLKQIRLAWSDLGPNNFGFQFWKRELDLKDRLLVFDHKRGRFSESGGLQGNSNESKLVAAMINWWRWWRQIDNKDDSKVGRQVGWRIQEANRVRAMKTWLAMLRNSSSDDDELALNWHGVNSFRIWRWFNIDWKSQAKFECVRKCWRLSCRVEIGEDEGRW